MGARWQTVRVFISSTFRDMHAERDYLVKVVFPALRERCTQRRLHLVDVDLRWGVTQEQAEMGRALEICLHEIELCRPFFVGLLGERYGHIPPHYDVPDEPAFDWVRRLEPGHSITALEIHQGVLNNPQMHSHAFFYFRDPAFLASLPPDQRDNFAPQSPHSARKLRKLKRRIRESGLPVRRFSREDLEAFGGQVLEDLWKAIELEHPEARPEPDPLDVERAYHDFFVAAQTELFVGQRHALKRLHAYAAGEGGGPMIVTGTPGCGKSALLAKFVKGRQELCPDTPILYHFIGASPASSDPRRMLHRLCGELAGQFGLDEQAGQDFDKLRVRFQRSLARAAETRRFVLVLDALNQLDERHRSHDLHWLPHPLPANLRLVLSCLEGDALEAARRSYPDRQELVVPPLRLVDQGFIVARQLARSRKRLTTVRQWRRSCFSRGLPAPREEERSQLRFILTGVWTRRRRPREEQTAGRRTADPLYLKIVTEELRLFGHFDRLNDFIASLPPDVDAVFDAVLERLERDHGRELVEKSLALVTTGRHGLLENELLELLAPEAQQRLPAAPWARLHRSLAFYLKPRRIFGGEEGLIEFFHPQLAETARSRYLATEQSRRDWHRRLGEYFRRKADPRGDGTWGGSYPRGLAELPYHHTQARAWEEIEAALTDLRFVEAKCIAGMTYELLDDYRHALDRWPGPGQGPCPEPIRAMSLVLRDQSHNLVLWPDLSRQQVIPFLQRRLAADSDLRHPGKPRGAVRKRPRRAGWYLRKAVPILVGWVRNQARGFSRKAFATATDTTQAIEYAEALALDPRGAPDGSLHGDSARMADRPFWLRLRSAFVPDVQTNVVVCRGHDGPVHALAAVDAGRLVSVGEDGTLRLWETSTTRQLAMLRLCRHPIVDAALEAGSPRGVALCRQCGPIAFDLEAESCYGLTRIRERTDTDLAGMGMPHAAYRACRAVPVTGQLLVARGPAFWLTRAEGSEIKGPFAEDLRDYRRFWDAGYLPEDFPDRVSGERFGDIISVAIDTARPLALLGYRIGGVLLWDVQRGKVHTYLPYCWPITHAIFQDDCILMGGIDPATGLNQQLRPFFRDDGKLIAVSHGYYGWMPLARPAAGGLWVGTDKDTNLYVVRRKRDRGFDEDSVCLKGHPGRIQCAAVDPLLRWAASGGEDAEIRIWDIQSRQETHAEPRDIPWMSCRMIDQPARLLLVSRQLGPKAESYHLIRLIYLPDEAIQRQMRTSRVVGPFFEVTRDGATGACAARPILSAFDALVMDAWSSARKARYELTPVERAASHLLVWSPESGALISDFAVARRGREVRQASLSPDGSLLAALLSNGTLVAYEAQGERLFPPAAAGVDRVCFLSGVRGGRALLGIAGPSLHELDWSHGEFRPVCDPLAGEDLTCACAFPDGRLALIGDAGGSLTIWDHPRRRVVRAWHAHDGPVIECRVAGGGAFAVSCGADRLTSLWEPSDGSRLARAPCEARPICCDVSADGRHVAAVDFNGSLYVWEVAPKAAMRLTVRAREGIEHAPER